MGVYEDIQAVLADEELTAREKRDAILDLRAEAYRQLAAHLPISRDTPWGTVTITGVSRDGRVVVIDGTGGGVSWPIRVHGAPVLVPDPAGTIIRGDRTYRVDPLRALRDVVADTVVKANQ